MIKVKVLALLMLFLYQQLEVVYSHLQTESTGSNLVALALSNGQIGIWDLESESLSYQLAFDNDFVLVLSNGLLVSEVNSNGQEFIQFWNIATGTPQFQLSSSESALEMLANGYLASATYYNSIVIWNTDEQTLVAKFPVSSTHFFLKQSRNSNFFMSADGNGNVFVWDENVYTLVWTSTGHTEKVFMIEALSNGNMVTASLDATLKIWHIKTGQCLDTINPFVDTLGGMKMISTDTIAVTGSESYVLIIEIYEASEFHVDSYVSCSFDWAGDIRITNSDLVLVASGDQLYTFNLTNPQSCSKSYNPSPGNNINQIAVLDPTYSSTSLTKTIVDVSSILK